MSKSRKIDTTAHPNLDEYAGWMIEAKGLNGELTGWVWSLAYADWVMPADGQLFPSYKAASVYQREYGLDKASLVVRHRFGGMNK